MRMEIPAVTAQHAPVQGVGVREQLASRYRRFAEIEARGRSPLYESIAAGVAADPFALLFLSALPEEKQQPNLLLAAMRHVCGLGKDWPEFRTMLRDNAPAVAAIMLARRTQTNEPARCATLLPSLARLPQPLALLEVGASAGLCLLPDRYGYSYGRQQIAAPSAEAPIFSCEANAATPIPATLPRIVWRMGLDLAPVAVTDDAQTEWLETLVWPEQEDRLQHLRAAIALARRDPPPIMRGDLLTDLAACARAAPADATLVVYHSAVLAYVADAQAREAFARAVRELGCVWISNEAPGVWPSVRDGVGRRGPRGAFLLAVDGRPMAWTDAHGAWIEWIEEDL
jgi:hypothetical protein